MAKDLILAKAQNAVLSHDWSTAAKLYKELLHDNASNVEYLKELGSIYVKAGEDEKAIPYYEQIITFYPHYVEAMNSLGAIYRRLKRYEESIQILQKAKDEGRDSASVNYNMGFTYKEMGNFEDAISAFESVITENPDDVLAYNHLGSIYYAQKSYEKSIAAYRRGLQVDPNHPILNYNLARCYEAANSYPEAVRCYNAALKTRPGWTDAIHDFSGLLVKCQQTKAAQDLVEQSIKLHPMNTDLLYILGNIYLHQFDYSNASRTLKKADSIKSNDVKILSALAEALEKGAKTDEALEKVLEAMDVDPDNKELRKQYAHTLLSAGNFERALENIQALYDGGSDQDLEVLDLYGQYYICMDDESKAKEYYSKINKINHHYKNYMLEAADRYVQSGNYEKAEKYALDFVERRAKSPEGYAKLGKIYAACGKLQNARGFYEKSLLLSGSSVISNSEIKRLDEELKNNPTEEVLHPVLTDYAKENALAESADSASEKKAEDAVPAEESGNESVELNSVPSLNDLADNSGDFDAAVFGEDEEVPEDAENTENAENTESESGSPEPEIPSAEELGIDSLAQPEDEAFDFNQLGDSVPLTDELAEEADNDFWSEFDNADAAAEGENPVETEPVETEPVASEPVMPVPAVSEPLAQNVSAIPLQNQITEEYIKETVDKAVDEKLQEVLAGKEDAAEESDVSEPVESKPAEEVLEDDGFADLTFDEDDMMDEDFMNVDSFENEAVSESEITENIESKENDEGMESDLEPLTDESGEESELPLEPLTEAEDNPLIRSVESADYMLDKIQKILNDTDLQVVSTDKIELFKTLRTLLDYLPEGEKNKSITRRMNMLLAYLIDKLSGKPGLLATSESLIKSGVLGEEYIKHLIYEKNGEITNSLISKVLIDMKNLSASLSDREIAKALCASADGILEQIELEDQKSRIF